MEIAGTVLLRELLNVVGLGALLAVSFMPYAEVSKKDVAIFGCVSTAILCAAYYMS